MYGTGPLTDGSSVWQVAHDVFVILHSDGVLSEQAFFGTAELIQHFDYLGVTFIQAPPGNQ